MVQWRSGLQNVRWWFADERRGFMKRRTAQVVDKYDGGAQIQWSTHSSAAPAATYSVAAQSFLRSERDTLSQTPDPVGLVKRKAKNEGT